tara:strand:+ start:41942 stop:42487 length:546 start_codon:yes stop_codon:yes gene_type:complete
VEDYVEPGSSELGKRIRKLVKYGPKEINPLSEAFLFFAARTQLINEFILPELKSGRIVICDRFFDSTLAYQGYGRGLDIKMLKKVNSFSIEGVLPDLTILLDLPTEVSLQRRNNIYGDRFESEDTRIDFSSGDNFHEKVRKGYLELSKADPNRWIIIDASLQKNEIAHHILQKVLEKLHDR